jgi:hypothetical protein
MAIELAVCAYCGVYGPTEREHAVPECMAPASLKGECQWVFVRACSRCNRQFSADESDFRDFCVLAGSVGDNAVRDALFYGPLKRNWERSGGKGKGALIRILEKIQTPDGKSPSSQDDLLTVPPDVRIVPNEKTFRIVRKIIRGLYFSHFTVKRGVPQVLSERRIRVVPIFDAPPDFLQEFSDCQTIHRDVFQYGFAECGDQGLNLPGLDSIWLLDAFKGAVFLVIVESNAFPLLGLTWQP